MDAPERQAEEIPAVLEPEEVRSLLAAVALRDRTMVLFDVVTGLRASELFGLKWADMDFNKNEISVTRSIVFQVVGPPWTAFTPLVKARA